jgi:hypothetical protein
VTAGHDLYRARSPRGFTTEPVVKVGIRPRRRARVEANSGLDPGAELSEEREILRDPATFGGPFAQPRGIPFDVGVLQGLEHRHTARTTSGRGTVEVEVRRELSRTQVTRHVRVIDQ